MGSQTKPATPVVATVEIDGLMVEVHAATYRQFMRASSAESRMEGTATLCDQTCVVNGRDEPASELLTIAGVNRALGLALGTGSAGSGEGADPT